MLLTITYEGENATDLGYLLRKNPDRPQTFDVGHGRAHVFYPEAAPARCTAALLLDLDPLDLARGKEGAAGGGLFDYVNDRPYVGSSFLSTAIARVFGSALNGRCESRPELAATPIPLVATLAMLPRRGEPDLLEKLFGPLGYQLSYETAPLDEKFPDWGESPYVDLTLSGTVRLADLLRHLYVLIPVLDRRKHYWVDEAEIRKLLKHGEGWLENHPAKDLIARRYFRKQRGLARLALARLDNGEGVAARAEGAEDAEGVEDAPAKLNAVRLAAVVEELRLAGASSVIDLGCGEGNLLRLLLADKNFTRIAGVDVSATALARAARNLELDRMPEMRKNRLSLFQSSLVYKDGRFAGYDAAAVVEVIEHLDPWRLDAFAEVLFGDGGARPGVVVVTTPNAEYNARYGRLDAAGRRHHDHRFEWTRTEFRAWAEATAARHGYTVRFRDIGAVDDALGAPTRMGVFICG